MNNRRDLINLTLINQENTWIKNKNYCNIICGGQSIDLLSTKELNFINNTKTNIAVNKSFLKFNVNYVVFHDIALFNDYIGKENWNSRKYPTLVTIRYTKELVNNLYSHLNDNSKLQNIYNNFMSFLPLSGINKIGNKLLYYYLNMNCFDFVLEKNSNTITRGYSATLTAINFAYKLGFKNILIWGLDWFGTHYKDYHLVDGKLPRPLGKLPSGFSEVLELERKYYIHNDRCFLKLQQLIEDKKIDCNLWNMSMISKNQYLKKATIKYLKNEGII